MTKKGISPKALPDVHLLKEWFCYDPISGALTWRKRRAQSSPAGSKCGSLNNDGYVHVSFFGKMYVAHRLIFKIMTGRDPTDEVDHINRDKADNCWENLREATRYQNIANVEPIAKGKSGLRGVKVSKSGRRWTARISVLGRNRNLGAFDTPQKARDAYIAAQKVLRGEFGEA